MRNGWQLVTIGEVLELQRRWLKLDPDRLYTEIGVRSFGKGIFHKTPVTGLSLGNKRVLRILPGDLVFNNVFAWEGAVGVASQAEAGTIGSHRFVTYTVKDNRADAQFVSLFFRTAAGLEILRGVSPGSAGRNKTLNLDQFAKQQVFLPSLSGQRRIVGRVEELAAKTEEARACRRSSMEEAAHVLPSALGMLSGLLAVDGRVGEVLLEKPRNGWSPHCDNSEGGVAVLSLGAVTGFRYNSAEHKRTSLPTSTDAHYWLRPGDLLITRSNTPELVGHAALYDGNPTPCVYSDLMMRLVVDSSKVSGEFLWYWLQTPIVREFIARNATGTSPTMKKISQGTVMAIPFPVRLPCNEQRRLVTYLNGLQARVDSLKSLQIQSRAELDALFPSILDKAFKGEL